MQVSGQMVRCAILLGLAGLAPFAAAQPIFTVLKAGGSATPLVLGAGGVLYGIGGGQVFPECPDGCGGVFLLTPPPAPQGSWTETTIYSFTSVQDGVGGSTLLTGPNGLLYGTTSFGGTGCHGSGCGTVFSLRPPGVTGAPWTKATFALNGGPNLPTSMVLSNEVLYGTSHDGGTAKQCYLGCGTFFSVTPPSGGQQGWSQKVLYSFTGGSDEYPSALIAGANGEFFGAAGGPACPASCSYVFSMTQTAPEGPWKETVLYTDTDTSSPNNFIGLAMGSKGVIYGTTTFGGAHGYGSVFSLTPPASPGGAWTETTLYSFQGAPDGAQPNPWLVIAANGALYGTTYFGGVRCPLDDLDGCGTVFSLTPPASPGGAWTPKILYAFTDGSDGGWPATGVTLGPSGVLYGSTTVGPGLIYGGIVFSLQP